MHAGMGGWMSWLAVAALVVGAALAAWGVIWILALSD